MAEHAVFIDPSYKDFFGDRLFDLDDRRLNRDGTLLPFVRLREHLANQGIPVHTADKLRDGSKRREINHYWSLGLVQECRELISDKSVRFRGFVLMEPPLIKPEIYSELPWLTSVFEKVYLHNTIGDGYSLKGVARDRLCPLFWPQPHSDVLSQYWDRMKRKNKLVVIAGNHNPRFRKPELYSERIKAIAELSGCDGIDLFGRGWDRWWSRQSFWWTYWRYRGAIASSYRGSCVSKWETLSAYRFSLCFENMPMTGYVTEKLFDCLYAGTVPIYWGAPNIDELVPAGAYVDMRQFGTYGDMLDHVLAMSEKDWQAMREIGRKFLRTRGHEAYCNSLIHMIRI